MRLAASSTPSLRSFTLPAQQRPAAEFISTMSRFGPVIFPEKMPSMIRAFSSAVPPTTSSLEALLTPRSSGVILYVSVLPPRISQTDVESDIETSSRRSSPYTTMPRLIPKLPMTDASGSSRDLS